MPTIHISGPHLCEYPDILRELKRLHIRLSTVRYVEVITQEIVFRHSNREPFGSMRFNPQAIAILHTSETVKLTLSQLIHDTALCLHSGCLGDGKVVYRKRKKGIRVPRNLTASQALELLEWLEQERAILEKAAQEEQSAPMQG